MQSMKKTSRNLGVGVSVTVVKHFLLPSFLRCRIYPTRELGPTPDHPLFFLTRVSPAKTFPHVVSFCRSGGLVRREMLSDLDLIKGRTRD